MEENIIIFKSSDKKEMLKITRDGFYVQGEKVEDIHDVYNRFHEWLKDAELNKLSD